MAADRLRQSDIVVDCMRSAIGEGASGLNDVPGLLKQIIQEELWRERVIQQTGEIAAFERFIDFIHTKPLEGLGTDKKTLERLCADDPAALDALDRATRNEPYIKSNDDVDNINVRPDGTSAAYALRKLRTGAPVLHARVLAGELSPHAAMIEAGYRRKTIQVPADVDGAAHALARKFTTQELQRLIELLSERVVPSSSSSERPR